MPDDVKKNQQSVEIGQHTIIIQQPEAQAPVKAGIYVLLATWVFLLLPVPGLSSAMASLLGIATLVISILCMVRGNVSAGVALLVADVIGGVIFYFIGMAIMLSMAAHQL